MGEEHRHHREEDDGKQNPLVHEAGATAPTYDTNEHADAKVEIRQPSGETISAAGEDPVDDEGGPTRGG